MTRFVLPHSQIVVGRQRLVVRLARLSCACGFLAVAACSAPTKPAVVPGSQPPVQPAQQPSSVAAQADPWAYKGELVSEWLPNDMPTFPLEPRPVPKLPAGLVAAPASCGSFGGKVSGAACATRAEALSSLDVALSKTDRKERDLGLAALESCGELPSWMVRALRAELAPVECADTIVGPLLATDPAAAGVDGAVYDAVFGLYLAGILSRAAVDAPRLVPPHDKKRVLAFLRNDLVPWVTKQATAIETLTRVGAKLRYYGRAVVAVEAGMVELRFIDAMRAAPLPDELSKDEELRNTYVDKLETTLAARKRRGRDAALVGLGSLATIGVIRDERVTRARNLLSRMYGGSPINALDVLLLPPLAQTQPVNTEQRLASKLQTFYAGLVFKGEAAKQQQMLRMFIEKGLALPHRIALSGHKPDAAERLLQARARFELGQNYWRNVDFDGAIKLLSGRAESADAKLLLALALSLHGGPKNAGDMMVRAPLSDLRVGHVAALDALAKEGGALATRAMFNAALVKQLAAPAQAPASYWLDVASRYRGAAATMADVQEKRRAEERAQEADQIAAAVEAQGVIIGHPNKN